ncbi:meteorin-like protein [Cylas formicarius]|uniref:meteorin-like protein n=1 Tax=Cylas formicarius TaxID=197179 RepID=UPI0029586985|nr:meteorin-like protein [Cylas formicarius]
MRRGATSRTSFCVFVCAFLIGLASTAILGDECDWTGSGLTSSPTSKGVTPVYLRCSAGKIKWLYPRGALRVLLRLPGRDRDFRACVKLRGVKPTARVFLEGPRSLVPLYADSEAAPTAAIRCFNSKNGQAAVYIEATEEQTYRRSVTDLEYDLQQLPKTTLAYDYAEECRPCSMAELAHVFCTSDLVTRGVILAIENDDAAETSRLSVKVTRLIRHTTASEEAGPNGVAAAAGDVDSAVTLNAPRRCGVSHGAGEFVFMARKKLGDLTLQCAPRFEDWAALVVRLNAQAHCVLKS